MSAVELLEMASRTAAATRSLSPTVGSLRLVFRDQLGSFVEGSPGRVPAARRTGRRLRLAGLPTRDRYRTESRRHGR